MSDQNFIDLERAGCLIDNNADAAKELIEMGANPDALIGFIKKSKAEQEQKVEEATGEMGLLMFRTCREQGDTPLVALRKALITVNYKRKKT